MTYKKTIEPEKSTFRSLIFFCPEVAVLSVSKAKHFGSKNQRQKNHIKSHSSGEICLAFLRHTILLSGVALIMHRDPVLSALGTELGKAH